MPTRYVTLIRKKRVLFVVNQRLSGGSVKTFEVHKRCGGLFIAYTPYIRELDVRWCSAFSIGDRRRSSEVVHPVRHHSSSIRQHPAVSLHGLAYKSDLLCVCLPCSPHTSMSQWHQHGVEQRIQQYYRQSGNLLLAELVAISTDARHRFKHHSIASNTFFFSVARCGQ